MAHIQITKGRLEVILDNYKRFDTNREILRKKTEEFLKNQVIRRRIFFIKEKTLYDKYIARDCFFKRLDYWSLKRHGVFSFNITRWFTVYSNLNLDVIGMRDMVNVCDINYVHVSQSEAEIMSHFLDNDLSVQVAEVIEGFEDEIKKRETEDD